MPFKFNLISDTFQEVMHSEVRNKMKNECRGDAERTSDEFVIYKLVNDFLNINHILQIFFEIFVEL